jgi:hypothetical protein
MLGRNRDDLRVGRGLVFRSFGGRNFDYRGRQPVEDLIENVEIDERRCAVFLE